MNNNKKNKERKRESVKITGIDLKASSIGWEIALPIVSGPVIGYLLDERFQTGPRYTLISLGFGLAVASTNLIRFIIQEYSQMQSSEDEKKNE